MYENKSSKINWSRTNREIDINSWELAYSKVEGATLSQRIKAIIKRTLITVKGK